MSEQKTRPTDVTVGDHLAAIEDGARRADCETLVEVMTRLTGCPPVMWGPSIVGFDRYHYRYASGHEGDACIVGFASGRRHLTLYLAPGFENEETRGLLARLGTHSTGKGCLYLKRLADVRMPVLEELVEMTVVEMRRRHPPSVA
jgi:hypothetical protein